MTDKISQIEDSGFKVSRYRNVTGYVVRASKLIDKQLYVRFGVSREGYLEATHDLHEKLAQEGLVK